MLLRELAAHARGRPIGDGDVPITSVEYDSRSVGHGSLFVAVRGLKVDGHAFLDRAVQNGASAVAVEAGEEATWRDIADRGTPVLVMDDTRVGLAHLAAALHGHPARRLKVVGVTGTDGKTSVADLVTHVLEQGGHRTGLISTASVRIGTRSLMETNRFTTPEAPILQGLLARMVDAGCEWAVIEATSHGLALHRVDACEFDVAIVTNVAADHLDFHGSVEAYRAAKGRLFEMLDDSVPKGVPKTAVLNADDPSCEGFRALSSATPVTYGFGEGSDVRIIDYRGDGWSSAFTLRTPAGDRQVSVPKPGRFNASNAAAAAAQGLAAGLSLDAIVGAIGTWSGAGGRMELIDEGQPFTVAVDFAHAPDSLRRALELMHETAPGRVIVVFGAIGEHDKDRRPGMARSAADAADFTIVTDDVPYSEDRDAIQADIRRGLESAGQREGTDFEVVQDRRDAVRRAISMARPGDAVLLAGMGHERTVTIGATKYACDDREVSRAVLRDLGYRH